MCGIIGYVAKGERDIESARFARAIDALAHRGPDQRGAWSEPGAALGFRRLAIIDLQCGQQPMTNEDGSLQLVFNGEIYNFGELRERLIKRNHRFRTRSDTEVILHLYEEEGERCVESLRGMFAFAIYNRVSRELFLARDRFGKKPLVYFETATGFYFASEIGALLQLADGPRQVSLPAIHAYLALDYVPGNQTAWQGIHRLPAAHTMRVEGGIARPAKRYWQLAWNPEPASRPDITEVQHRLRELLEESVRLRLVADVPLGAFLSGGIDSSVTVAAMTRVGARVKTFCVGFEEARFNEAPYARQVAEALGTEHQEAIVAPDSLHVFEPLLDKLGEPFADQSIIPTFLLSQFTRQYVTVALSGDGGDELFAGYKRYRHLARADFLDRWGLVHPWRTLSKTAFKFEQLFNRSRRSLRWPRSPVDRIMGHGFLKQYLTLVGAWDAKSLDILCKGRSTENLAGTFLDDAMKRNNNLSGPRLCQAVDADTYLIDDILRKVDLATMACSLECRCPILDHKLAEFAATLPQTRSRFDKTKALLRTLYPKLLPPAIFDREKKGFSMPIGHWMRNQWKDPMQQVIHDPLPGAMESLFDRAVLRAMWQDHQAGRHDHSQKLWAWYVLCRWNDRFKPDWPG